MRPIATWNALVLLGIAVVVSANDAFADDSDCENCRRLESRRRQAIITPENAVWLAGYGSKRRPMENSTICG